MTSHDTAVSCQAGVEPDLLGEAGNLVGSSGPEDVEVDGEVVVHHAMTHPGDPPPGDLRVEAGKFGRQPARGLPDDLDQVRQDDLKVLVVVEPFAAALRANLDLLGRVENVSKALAIVSHRSTTDDPIVGSTVTTGRPRRGSCPVSGD